ncbi:MAG: hypothetical protein QM784_10800 [Polyangiaceae bacterium]
MILLQASTHLRSDELPSALYHGPALFAGWCGVVLGAKPKNPPDLQSSEGFSG